eukprot:9695216-Lingulodinium_polyedra.AAC.1
MHLLPDGADAALYVWRDTEEWGRCNWGLLCNMRADEVHVGSNRHIKQFNWVIGDGGPPQRDGQRDLPRVEPGRGLPG